MASVIVSQNTCHKNTYVVTQHCSTAGTSRIPILERTISPIHDNPLHEHLNRLKCVEENNATQRNAMMVWQPHPHPRTQITPRSARSDDNQSPHPNVTSWRYSTSLRSPKPKPQTGLRPLPLPHHPNHPRHATGRTPSPPQRLLRSL